MLGILGTLEEIYQLCSVYKIQQGAIKFYCDGKSALFRSLWRYSPVSPNEKHSDLISAIIALERKIPISISAFHIKAHQDTYIPLHKLTTAEKLNTKVDLLAKKFLLSLPNRPSFATFQQHPESFITIRHITSQITQELSYGLYYSISSLKLDKYWIHKNRYKTTNVQSIDWNALSKSSQLMPTSRRNFISKWCSSTIGVGTTIQKWKHRPFSFCPYCEHGNENTEHVLLCPHQDSSQLWAQNCIKFISALAKIDTCSYAVLAIQRCLLQWRLKKDVTIYDHLYPPDLRQVLYAQHKLGWRAFSEGLLSTSWVPYQQKYYTEIGSRRSPELWASKVIRLIWNFTWDIWNERNKRIHDTERIKQLEGKEPLLEAILQEWSIGLGRLPASDFAYLLSGNEEEILSASLPAQRRWLALVRNGRILLDMNNILYDEFITNDALRNWVGIIPIKHGTPVFQETKDR